MRVCVFVCVFAIARLYIDLSSFVHDSEDGNAETVTGQQVGLVL